MKLCSVRRYKSFIQYPCVTRLDFYALIDVAWHAVLHGTKPTPSTTTTTRSAPPTAPAPAGRPSVGSPPPQSRGSLQTRNYITTVPCNYPDLLPHSLLPTSRSLLPLPPPPLPTPLPSHARARPPRSRVPPRGEDEQLPWRPRRPDRAAHAVQAAPRARGKASPPVSSRVEVCFRQI